MPENNTETVPWVMPDWMEHYRPLIHTGGKGTIEELVEDYNPLAFTATFVREQIGLLLRLHEQGALMPNPAHTIVITTDSPAVREQVQGWADRISDEARTVQAGRPEHVAVDLYRDGQLVSAESGQFLIHTTPEEHPQPNTHRVAVHVVWSEVALYAEDVEIDVPDGFTGDPADLLDVDDSEYDDEQWQELGVDPAAMPETFTTNWLKRVDFGAPKEISERQFHDRHVTGTSPNS